MRSEAYPGRTPQRRGMQRNAASGLFTQPSGLTRTYCHHAHRPLGSLRTGPERYRHPEREIRRRAPPHPGAGLQGIPDSQRRQLSDLSRHLLRQDPCGRNPRPPLRQQGQAGLLPRPHQGPGRGKVRAVPRGLRKGGHPDRHLHP